MTEELFSVGESMSPKLKWLRKHGLVTHFSQETLGDPDSCAWTCAMAKMHPGFSIREGIIGVGNTEEEACIDYAIKNDIPHYTLNINQKYNEHQIPPP